MEKHQTPLKKAEGLGSAHEGATHWWHQRITAFAAVPLIFWLVCSVASHVIGASYEAFTVWLSAPHNAVLMILSILMLFYHAALGTQVIIEDYLHNMNLRIAKLILTKLFFMVAAVVCVFAVLKIAFMPQ